MTAAPPPGFRVELATTTRLSRGGTLVFGGSPARLLRLNRRAYELLSGGSFTVDDRTSARLARRLLDAGVVHPRPPAAAVRSAAIVIPVRDRQDMLARVLRGIRSDPTTTDTPVVVVDDGSRDGATIRAVALAHGATVVRHETCGGPAAARNSGLRATDQPFVAFCDSDVVPHPGWLPPLLAQFHDPAVGLAAPRIVALPEDRVTRIGSFERTCSPLDLGPAEAPVIPMSTVAYLPSAAMVLRRAAAPEGFAEDLRVAEDVDLCLRLHESGWRLRYVPTAQVAHDHRTGLPRWLARRAFYGSGAAILARRHPGQVPPMHVTAWSVAALCLLLTRRPLAVAAAVGVTATVGVRLARRIPDADTPVRAASLLTLAGLRSTALQLLRAGIRHHWPLGLVLATGSRRVRRLLIVTSIVDDLVERKRKRSTLDPLTFVALRRLDDLAYGAGVWWGAIRHRTLAPLVPKITGLPGGGSATRRRRRETGSSIPSKTQPETQSTQA